MGGQWPCETRHERPAARRGWPPRAPHLLRPHVPCEQVQQHVLVHGAQGATRGLTLVVRQARSGSAGGRRSGRLQGGGCSDAAREREAREEGNEAGGWGAGRGAGRANREGVWREGEASAGGRTGVKAAEGEHCGAGAAVVGRMR